GACVLELRGHTRSIWGIGYAPDGACIATSSFDASVRSFDARSGRALRVLHGHTREVSALAWDCHGSRLFTGSRDGTLRAWNVESGDAVTVLPHRCGA